MTECWSTTDHLQISLLQRQCEIHKGAERSGQARTTVARRCGSIEIHVSSSRRRRGRRRRRCGDGGGSSHTFGADRQVGEMLGGALLGQAPGRRGGGGWVSGGRSGGT